MIVRNKSGYQLKSKDGKKNLSKPNLSKAAVLKRLRAVEYFKHHPGK